MPYESPNIVIVPTESFCSASAPRKKPKIEGKNCANVEVTPVGGNNTGGKTQQQQDTSPNNSCEGILQLNQSNDLTLTFHENTSVSLSDKNENSSSFSRDECDKMVKKTLSWASNYLKSIGQTNTKHVKLHSPSMLLPQRESDEDKHKNSNSINIYNAQVHNRVQQNDNLSHSDQHMTTGTSKTEIRKHPNNYIKLNLLHDTNCTPDFVKDKPSKNCSTSSHNVYLTNKTKKAHSRKLDEKYVDKDKKYSRSKSRNILEKHQTKSRQYIDIENNINNKYCNDKRNHPKNLTSKCSEQQNSSTHKSNNQEKCNTKLKLTNQLPKKTNEPETLKKQTSDRVDNLKSRKDNNSKAISTNVKEIKSTTPLKSVVQVPKNYGINSNSSQNIDSDRQDLRLKLKRKYLSYETTKRDNLLIEVQNKNEKEIENDKKPDKLSTIKFDSPKPKQEAKKFKKIKLVINLICEKCSDSSESESDTKSNEIPLANVDLSFLDDLNVDDIVDCLNATEKISHNHNDTKEEHLNMKHESKSDLKQTINMLPIEKKTKTESERNSGLDLKRRYQEAEQVENNAKLDEKLLDVQNTIIDDAKNSQEDNKNISGSKNYGTQTSIQTDILKSKTVLSNKYNMNQSLTNMTTNNVKTDTPVIKCVETNPKCEERKEQIINLDSNEPELFIINSEKDVIIISDTEDDAYSIKINPQPNCKLIGDISEIQISDKAHCTDLSDLIKNDRQQTITGGSTGSSILVKSSTEEEIKEGTYKNCKTHVDTITEFVDLVTEDECQPLNGVTSHSSECSHSKDESTTKDVDNHQQTTSNSDNFDPKYVQPTNNEANILPDINNSSQSMISKPITEVKVNSAEVKNSIEEQNNINNNTNKDKNSVVQSPSPEKDSAQKYKNNCNDIQESRPAMKKKPVPDDKSTINLEKTGIISSALETKIASELPADNGHLFALHSRMLAYFGEEYNITSLIRHGKFSRVYQCEDVRGRVFALKVMHVHHTVSYRKKELILKSIRQDIPKSNFHCIFLIDAFATQGRWCYLMEYFPNNLQMVLAVQGISFHIDTVQKLSRQLISALVILRNNNVAHLGMKPEHILLDATNARLKLAGFDEARYLNDIELLPNVGTVSYRPPEVILGFPLYVKVDVWAAALIMYEMATNRKLFPGCYNNDILFKQQCTVGQIPACMLERCVHRSAHYSGPFFLRKFAGNKCAIIRSFNQSSRLKTSIMSAYKRDWSKQRSPGDKSRDTTKLHQFENLLENMLIADPLVRMPVEFVYTHSFLYELSNSTF